jgi:hypothetical protein|tara:strand:- start:722 stop:1021 length:300 start_codon:yes stop_codon:yes gene_type:complete
MIQAPQNELEKLLMEAYQSKIPNEVSKDDVVNSPSHYTSGGIECIDYLKDNLPLEAFHGYLEGNVKKYLHRWRYKQKPVQDLKKAQWYLANLIAELEGQ